jgi:hypothetical protein
MAAFDYRQAEEIRDAFGRHGVRYLFIGKAGAILLGFPDTTQDADLFVDRTPENGAALVPAIRELGFALTVSQAAEIVQGKDFVQLKNGPFDLDLVFAPDGIERFSDAWARRMSRDFPCVTPTTSLPARRRPTASRTANRFPGSGHSGTTGHARGPERRVLRSALRLQLRVDPRARTILGAAISGARELGVPVRRQCATHRTSPLVYGR